MTESQLREGFQRLAAPVTPAPEAFQRLVIRGRRRTRARLAALTTGIAGVVAAALMVPLALTPAADPSPAPDNPAPDVWVRQILDGPVRGDLASDHALLNSLEGMVTAQLQPIQRPAKVVYASDVDTARVAYVLYGGPDGPTGVWVVGPRGADARRLADSQHDQRVTELNHVGWPVPSLRLSVEPGDPLGFVSHTAIALAPPGCTFATAPLRGGSWHDTRSDTLIRAYAQATERWRISCDGIVRFEGASWGLFGSAVSPLVGDYYGVYADPRTRRAAATLAWSYVSDFSGWAAGPPAIRYTQPGIAVGVTRLADGNGRIVAEYNGDRWGTSWSVTVAGDPLRPGLTLVMPLYPPGKRDLPAVTQDPAGPSGSPVPAETLPPVTLDPRAVLVLGPALATQAQVLDAGGTVLGSSALANGTGVLDVPVDGRASLRLRLLDATGRKVTTVPVVAADPYADLPDPIISWT
jgi:hypothetical protein